MSESEMIMVALLGGFSGGIIAVLVIVGWLFHKFVGLAMEDD